jgi:predicted nucleic acid-binding Zn finger protein
MQSKELIRKINNYLKQYYREDFKSKKIIDAIELIKDNRIFEIKSKVKGKRFFIIRGKRDTYITIKGLYCSCYGFTAALIKNKIKPCYHLLACEIVEQVQQIMPFFETKDIFKVAIDSNLEKYRIKIFKQAI